MCGKCEDYGYVWEYPYEGYQGFQVPCSCPLGEQEAEKGLPK